MPNEKGTNLQQMFDDLTQKTASAIKEIQSGDAAWKYSLEMQSDELLIPKFSFNIETNYNSLEGSEFKMGDKPYLIEEAYQRTAFLLDEEGAKAESVAEETVVTEEAIEPVEKPHPKKLHFNKPFLVILKRKDSPNPYFAMWVENTELMQK
jgi:serine protease inhibitor